MGDCLCKEHSRQRKQQCEGSEVGACLECTANMEETNTSRGKLVRREVREAGGVVDRQNVHASVTRQAFGFDSE